MKPLVALVAVLVALAVGGQAQTPEIDSDVSVEDVVTSATVSGSGPLRVPRHGTPPRATAHLA